MKILISNDDGYDSQGLLGLFHRLEEDGHDVTVVAPTRERSTAGHSLTLHKPLRIHEMGRKIFAVSGSPADSVHLGTRFVLKSKPDLIISGINRGANLGTDIFYSGTVAAAREGYLSGIPALAVSLCYGFPDPQSEYHWDVAIEYVSEFVRKIIEGPGLAHWLLNINIPNAERLRGTQWVRQGRRYYSDNIVINEDPRGRPYYWLGAGVTGYEPSEGSDCVAIANGFVSVTPLKIDTTDDQSLPHLAKTFANI